MKSNVYFAKVDSDNLKDRIAALGRIINEATPFSSYGKDEIIPVKLTIGDSSCIYNINPELVKFIIFSIKKSKARPFLFDTSVIYTGQRQNAVDHLNLVQSKGFGHSKTSAPFIVADGLFGQDGREFDILSAYLKKIKVPSFVGILDRLVVLSHVTGHILAGYAGAIKNVAMGMACRSTKQVQHSSLRPVILEKKCVACGCCISFCPAKAISLKGNKVFIDQKLCVGCGECLCICRFSAVSVNWQEDAAVFCRRMVDVADFILRKFKNKFFVNFAFDITKECDCLSTKDEKMVFVNLGILASSDILSLDKATADMMNKSGGPGFFTGVQDAYGPMFEYAGERGLGNIDYNIVNV